MEASRTGPRPSRVAFSPDLGLTPVDPEIAAICEKSARRFGEIGVAVEAAAPDLSGAPEVFQVLRAAGLNASLGPLLDSHPEVLKPEAVWNIELGRSLTGERIAWATRERGEIFHRMLRFFDEYDLLPTPATIVGPFPVEQRWVESCAGHRFENYIEWLTIAYAITITGCPALSLPCGFTSETLPVGLQMVGRPNGEADLLAGARLLEEVLGLRARTPIAPASGG